MKSSIIFKLREMMKLFSYRAFLFITLLFKCAGIFAAQPSSVAPTPSATPPAAEPARPLQQSLVGKPKSPRPDMSQKFKGGQAASADAKLKAAANTASAALPVAATMTTEQKAALNAKFYMNRLAVMSRVQGLTADLKVNTKLWREAIYEQNTGSRKLQMGKSKEREKLIEYTTENVKAQIQRFIEEQPISLSTPKDALAMLWTHTNSTDALRDNENQPFRELVGAIEEVWEPTICDECTECWCCCCG